jgi:peptidoglycan-associated lipoprotein
MLNQPPRPRGLLAGMAAVALLLAACAAPIRLDEPAPVDDRNASAPGAAASAAQTDRPAGGDAAGSGGALPVGESSVTPVTLGDAEAVGVGRVLYFDLDSYTVKPEYRGVIEAAAVSLNANRQRRLLVEGHTDERGGREYNLALGQKRADAVVRALRLLGPQEQQLEAASYGKERPAVEGSTEAAWARNRRVELKDR